MTETPPPNSSEKPPPSFGDLARKLRSRTTDLLAIAIILVGGFAVGGRVSQWWETEDATTERPVQNTNKAVSPNDAPVELDFGNSPFTLNRRILTGDRPSALKQLTIVCDGIAEQLAPPTQPATKNEKQLLAALSEEKPVQISNGRRVYLKDGPVPLTVVTAGAERSLRVVCWGLVFPSGKNRWTAYAFHAAKPEGNAGSASPVKIPLPPKARTMMTIRGRGNTWRTFRSTRSVTENQQFYSKWFESHGWTATTSTNVNSGWAAAFVRTTETRTFRAELQIAAAASNGSTGVAYIQQINE